MEEWNGGLTALFVECNPTPRSIFSPDPRILAKTPNQERPVETYAPDGSLSLISRFFLPLLLTGKRVRRNHHHQR